MKSTRGLGKILFLLTKNNTGYNSKTQVMLQGVILVTIVTISLLPLMYLSAIWGYTVPWYGIQSVFTSLATLQGVLIYGKIKTDSQYYGNYNHRDNVSENEPQKPDPSQLEQ